MNVFNYISFVQQYMRKVISWYLVLVWFFDLVKANDFNTNPTYSAFGMSGAKGMTAAISGDQSMIGVGFSDSTFKIFNMQLTQLCFNTSTPDFPIISSVWIPSFGPVTVDSSYVLTTWSNSCQIINQTTLTDLPLGIQYFEQQKGNITGLIGVNLGFKIQEYEVINLNLVRTYYHDEQDIILDMLYSYDGTTNVLIASTQKSKILTFNMQTGKLTNSFYIQSPIKKMMNYHSNQANLILGLGKDNQIYIFKPGTSRSVPAELGTLPQLNDIEICPGTNQLAMALQSSSEIGMYLYQCDRQSILTGLYGNPQSIDCSSHYLVAVDNGGYINLYTYNSWNIQLITGIGAALLLLIIAIVMFIIKSKKEIQKKYQYIHHDNNNNKRKRQQYSRIESGPDFLTIPIQ